MNRALGQAGVVVALIAAVAGIVSIAVGLYTQRPDRLRSARGWAVVVGIGSLIAFAAMERALNTLDFTVQYVAYHCSSATPDL